MPLKYIKYILKWLIRKCSKKKKYEKNRKMHLFYFILFKQNTALNFLSLKLLKISDFIP